MKGLGVPQHATVYITLHVVTLAGIGGKENKMVQSQKTKKVKTNEKLNTILKC